MIVNNKTNSMSESKKPDMFKQMAVAQGYVPEDCEMIGHLVMTFVRGGTNPCEGCHFTKCSNKNNKTK